MMKNLLKYSLLLIALVVLLSYYNPTFKEHFESISSSLLRFSQKTIDNISKQSITNYGIWCANPSQSDSKSHLLPSGFNNITVGCFCPQSSVPRNKWVDPPNPQSPMNNADFKKIRDNNKGPVEIYIGLGGDGDTPGKEDTLMKELTTMYNSLNIDNKFDGIDFDLEGGIADWSIYECVKFVENFEKAVTVKKTMKIQITILPKFLSTYQPDIYTYLHLNTRPYKINLMLYAVNMNTDTDTVWMDWIDKWGRDGGINNANINLGMTTAALTTDMIKTFNDMLTTYSFNGIKFWIATSANAVPICDVATWPILTDAGIGKGSCVGGNTPSPGGDKPSPSGSCDATNLPKCDYSSAGAQDGSCMPATCAGKCPDKSVPKYWIQNGDNCSTGCCLSDVVVSNPVVSGPVVSGPVVSDSNTCTGCYGESAGTCYYMTKNSEKICFPTIGDNCPGGTNKCGTGTGTGTEGTGTEGTDPAHPPQPADQPANSCLQCPTGGCLWKQSSPNKCLPTASKRACDAWGAPNYAWCPPPK